jgi:hypothetical protein
VQSVQPPEVHSIEVVSQPVLLNLLLPEELQLLHASCKHSDVNTAACQSRSTRARKAATPVAEVSALCRTSFGRMLTW